MAAVLTAYHNMTGNGELVTTEQIALNYAHIPADELETNFAIIEHVEDGVVSYARTGSDDTPEGHVHYWIAPFYQAHLTQPLFAAVIAGLEQRALERARELSGSTLIRCWQSHPGPGKAVDGTPVAWLEEMGYRVSRFGAVMLRPDLDHILDLALPEGVEVRTVSADHLRTIWEAEVAAFKGSFGEMEATEKHWLQFRDDPIADPTLWKVAWAGDRVVGSIRSFINEEENDQFGRLRGYTEHISTHPDWRGRGLASALLALSLREIRDRGMKEAALGVDTQNPANAFAIYERLGFQLTAYDAVLDKPMIL